MLFLAMLPAIYRLISVLLLFAIPWTTFIRPVISTPINARATIPALDLFYVPPADFESTLPGTILRSRQIIPAYFGLVLQPVKAYQLLYRTTAIDGSAIATATTVFKPLNAAPDRFVSFQTAYDSAATICNPSYNYQLGSVPLDLISSIEQLIIQIYLNEGYIVSSSDYEGPDAAFSAGRLSGMATLDSMRAVINFGKTLKFSTDRPAVVGVDYSGGGIATSWAAALQPIYAPEIPIRGWASGGTPANLTGTIVFLDDTLFSGLLLPGVAGLNKPSSYRSQLNPILKRILTVEGRLAIEFANGNCAPADLLVFPDRSILSTEVQFLGSSLLFEPTVASILNDNILALYRQDIPSVPVLLYHASQDEIIPYSNASTLFQSWCKDGAVVQFTTYAAGGHLTTEILGVIEAIRFTRAAFAGSLPTACSSNTILDNDLDPVALGVNLEPILIRLLQLLVDAGDQDSNIRDNLRILTG